MATVQFFADLKQERSEIRPTRLLPILAAFVLARFVRMIFPAPDIQPSVFTRHYDFFYDRFAPIKIFMYNISINNNTKLCKNQFCEVPVKKSAAHTFYFEAVLHHAIEKGTNRVYDQKSADIFYVPIYLGLYNMNRKKADFDAAILPLVRKQGIWYDRYGAVDQVFVQLLFSHDNIPFTQIHQEFIAAQTTIGDVNWQRSIQNPREMWRYTVMPYNSNFGLVPINKTRYMTAFLIGQFNLQTFDRRAKFIRQALYTEMRITKNTAVIQTKRKSHFKAADLFNIEQFMSFSEFCPVPHGDGPASKRMYDSLKTGCIPIVLTDEIRFPFEKTFVDYENVLLQIPAFNPYYIRLAIGATNKRRREKIRKAQQELDRVLCFEEGLEKEKGGTLWAWMWMQFFKASTVAASKRRDLIKSAYL